MNRAQIMTIVILAAMAGLFLWDRWRYDVVALLALLAAVAAGIVPAGRAFSGFADPVLPLIAAALAVGAAIGQSGAVEILVRRLNPLMRSPDLQVGAGRLRRGAVGLRQEHRRAASLAGALGFRIDPFLMAVAVGAGSDFLSPIGHQSNTLAMGPGGYRFGDYGKLGLPLSLLAIGLGVPLIMVFWPLH